MPLIVFVGSLADMASPLRVILGGPTYESETFSRLDALISKLVSHLVRSAPYMAKGTVPKSAKNLREALHAELELPILRNSIHPVALLEIDGKIDDDL